MTGIKHDFPMIPRCNCIIFTHRKIFRCYVPNLDKMRSMKKLRAVTIVLLKIYLEATLKARIF